MRLIAGARRSRMGRMVEVEAECDMPQTLKRFNSLAVKAISLGGVQRLVMAAIPFYDGGIDSTLVVYEDGNFMIEHTSVRRFIHHMAKRRGLQLSYVRQIEMGDHIRGYTLPFTIDPLHTFIMMKCRNHPIGRDPAYGYFNSYLLFSGLFASTTTKESAFVINRTWQIPIYLGLRSIHSKLWHAYESHRAYICDLKYMLELPCNSHVCHNYSNQYIQS